LPKSNCTSGILKHDVRPLAIVLFFCFLTVNISSQTILKPEFDPPDKRFDNFFIPGGEASQTSTCILLDRQGFFWTGTEAGLYRYDGSRYVEYSLKRERQQTQPVYMTCLFEDSDGDIWAGSKSGLNRVDRSTGSQLLIRPDSTVKTDRSNTIRSISQASDSLLWIRTGKNIYSLDKKTLKFTHFEVDTLSWYSNRDDFPADQNCFLEDTCKNLWFVTNRGLYRVDADRKTFRDVMTQNDPYGKGKVKKVNCIISDLSGGIWIGTDGAGLLRWNQITDSPEIPYDQSGISSGTNSVNVTSILADSSGTIWSFGTDFFCRFDQDEKENENYRFLYGHQTVYENPGSSVTVDQSFRLSDGTIWFFSREEGLIYKFDPLSEKLYLYRTPAFAVFQCLLDSHETFWFACVRYNVFRMILKQIPFFTIYPVNNTSDVAQAYKGSIVEDRFKRTWFLFNQGIFTVKNFDLSSSINFKQMTLPGGVSTTSSGFADSKDNLWFGSKDGKIVRYDPLTNSITDYTLPFPPDNKRFAKIPIIREDKNGNIWVVTTGHGLYRLNNFPDRLEFVTGFQPHFVKNEQNYVNDFIVDSKNNLWILSTEHVLKITLPVIATVDLYNTGDEAFREFNANLRVREDLNGGIWILNGISGLNKFDKSTGSFRSQNPIDDISPASYYDLLIDRKGRFWIAHNKGISVWDPVTGSVRTIKMPLLQYDVQAYQLSSGKIIYINENQLYVFDEDPPRNTIVPPVRITNLQVNGENYKLPAGIRELSSLKKIVLPFRDNFISIEYAALNFINPEENRYRFFMKGIDRDTIDAGQGSPAEYRGIHPGSYRFWVTGSNNDGLWNTEGFSIDIRILPPWYRSLAAFVSYILLVFFLIALYIRKRTRSLTIEKIRLEAEVKARTKELEEKNLQLAETDRIKTHFFTDISHEIRTPLTLITSPLEIISKEAALTSRLSEMVEMMKRNAQRLMNLVNQLLDISKLDAGKMLITVSEDDLIRFLRILVYEFLSVAESKQIKYIAELPDQAFTTWFDRDKTEKIISNLLSNAFKYTASGGTVKCIVKIEPGPEHQNGILKISIIDTGQGIAPENIGKIFDRFYRIEGHHERDNHGTGIGLSLVNEFITLLHGNIEVKSVPGEGSEFSITIPVGRGHLKNEEYIILSQIKEGGIVDHMIARFETVDNENTQPQMQNRVRILLIEDNEDLRTYIRESLQNGYAFLEADDGISGLNTAFTMMPDLIVSDVMMPDLNGIELCRKLKNDVRTSHIPVIMLTARATTDDRIKGLKSGADDYLVKPFNITELEVRIENLLLLRDKLKAKYSRLHLLELADQQVISVDDRFMAGVLKIIRSNLRNFDFDVETLHQQIGMSKTHLTRKIKALTGLTPGILIRNIRLERAADLLKSKAGNVTEVANSVGISNPSNFTKSFRKYFGKSPKDFFRN